MEDLDKENSDLVSDPLIGSAHDGLRHRTTTTTTTTAAAEGDEDGGGRKERKERKMISEELRELLVGWKPEH